MIYAYAFLQPSEAELVLPGGICGSTELVTAASVAALIERDVRLTELQTDDNRLVQAVFAHDRAIRWLFQQTPVLPLRFGTQFVDPEALLTHLVQHQSHYRQALEWLGGKAEYRIQFTPLDPIETGIAETLRGKEYFLAKKQQQQAQHAWRQQQQAEIEQTIARLTQQFEVQRMPTAATEKVYLLTDRTNESYLAEMVESLQRSCQHWTVELGERLPPYHFTQAVFVPSDG